MLQYMPWGIMWIGTGTDLRLPAERVLFPVFCLRVLLANGSDSSGSSKHGGCAMLRHHTEKGPRVWSPHRFALRKQQLLIASDCINETNILRKHRKNCSILCLKKKKKIFWKSLLGGKVEFYFLQKLLKFNILCRPLLQIWQFSQHFGLIHRSPNVRLDQHGRLMRSGSEY